MDELKIAFTIFLTLLLNTARQRAYTGRQKVHYKKCTVFILKPQISSSILNKKYSLQELSDFL